MSTQITPATNAKATTKSKEQPKVQPKVRCAIYTRKSTDKGLDSEFNTLENQRLYCARYIEFKKHEGWYALPESYDDGGFSGDTNKRPALQRLLDDIRAGLIDVVIVYKIERFSRSLLGFADMHKVMKEHQVSFVSVSEQFDTSTPLGEAFLKLILVFAELERANGRVRVLDKIASSKQRGMWLGGNLPLGYESIDKKLVIIDQEAEIVRFIFSEFIKRKSIRRLAEVLIEKGFKTKKYNGLKLGDARFTPGTLYKIIKNPLYAGKIHHKGSMYDGQHKPIISDEMWTATQRILQINSKARAGISKRKIPAVLCGLLKCGCCDSSMVPSHTRKKHGKIYRYYVPNTHSNTKCANCQIKQISAPEIEGVVLSQVHQILQSPELIASTWRKVNQEANMSEEQMRETMSSLDTTWRELFPIEQENLLRLMLDKVIVHTDHLDIRVRTDSLMPLMPTTTVPTTNSLQIADDCIDKSAVQSCS